MWRFKTFTWYQSQWTVKQKLHQNILQVQNIEDNEKDGFPKRIHSYTLQLFFMEG
jgi:hypothetical protein